MAKTIILLVVTAVISCFAGWGYATYAVFTPPWSVDLRSHAITFLMTTNPLASHPDDRMALEDMDSSFFEDKYNRCVDLFQKRGLFILIYGSPFSYCESKGSNKVISTVF